MPGMGWGAWPVNLVAAVITGIAICVTGIISSPANLREWSGRVLGGVEAWSGGSVLR